MKIIKLFLFFFLISNAMSVLRCMDGYQPLNETSSENKTLDISEADLNQPNFEKNLYQTIKKNKIVTLKLSLAQFLNFPENLLKLFLKKELNLRVFDISSTTENPQILGKIRASVTQEEFTFIFVNKNELNSLSEKDLLALEKNSEILKIIVGEITIYIVQNKKENKWKKVSRTCMRFGLTIAVIGTGLAIYQYF